MEQQLAAMPEMSGRRIRVINASGSSFTARQSLVLLVTRILNYDPDVIVVFHGPETLYYPTACECRPGYPFNFSVREHQYEKLRGNIEGPNPLIALIMGTRTMKRFHPNLARQSLQTKLATRNRVITIDSLEQYDTGRSV